MDFASWTQMLFAELDEALNDAGREDLAENFKQWVFQLRRACGFELLVPTGDTVH